MLDSIRGFAGPDLEKAVVADEAALYWPRSTSACGTMKSLFQKTCSAIVPSLARIIQPLPAIHRPGDK